MQQDDRPWLIGIHCINHKVELAVKEAFDGAGFSSVDSLYQTIFSLLQNSGIIKSDVLEAAKVLDISAYTLPKLTGTRFVSHRVKALGRLINMWPALISAFENTIVVRKHKPETKAKIQKLIKDLRSYELLTLACSYLDVLLKISPASLVFETESTLPTDTAAVIQRTKLELEDLEENAGTEEEFDSHLKQFSFNEETKELKGTFVKHGDMLKLPKNRKNVTIPLENFKELNNRSLERAASKEKSSFQRLPDNP